MHPWRRDVDWHFASTIVSLIWLVILAAALIAVLLRAQS